MEKPTQNSSQINSANQSATDILHFEKWLAILGQQKGTDLHLSVGNVPMIRLNGKISPLVGEEVLTQDRINRVVEGLLDSVELENLKKNKQIIIGRTLKKFMRFRVHIFYSRGFLGLSMHHLPSETIPISEFPHSKILSSTITASQGLFIVSGPFDSGKTSTIKSMLSEINNTQEKYIVTLERPVEYLLPSNKSSIVQFNVGTDVPSFAEGISSLENEDVDVIFSSEIPDIGTLEAILNAAGSGRICLATLPFVDTVSAIEYLIDLAQEEEKQRIMRLLSESLLGLVTQVLLPKIGGGRVLVASVMASVYSIRSLIKEGRIGQIVNIMQTSREQGMITIDKALVEAVRDGVIDIATAKEYAVDFNKLNI